MLQRIRTSRWIRGGLFLVILGFCSYGLTLDWPQVQGALVSLHWYSIAGAVAAAVTGQGCMMLAWRRLLGDLGSKLPIPIAARVTFIAQLGKYVPGAVWSFAAYMELGHDHDVPRRRSAASVIVALALAVATGLLIAAVSLPLASPAAARKYVLFLAAVPIIAICLAPPILRRLLNLALKIIRLEPLEQAVSWRGLGVAVGFSIAGWLVAGLQVWLLVSNMTTRSGVHLLPISVGAYALACTAALMLVVFPGGIGAREVIMVAALMPVLPQGAALAVAIVVRAVTTAADLALGGVAVALARSARYGRSTGTTELTSHGAPEVRRSGRHRKPSAGRQRVTRRTSLQDPVPSRATAEPSTSQRPEIAF